MPEFRLRAAGYSWTSPINYVHIASNCIETNFKINKDNNQLIYEMAMINSDSIAFEQAKHIYIYPIYDSMCIKLLFECFQSGSQQPKQLSPLEWPVNERDRKTKNTIIKTMEVFKKFISMRNFICDRLKTKRKSKISTKILLLSFSNIFDLWNRHTYTHTQTHKNGTKCILFRHLINK